MKRSPLRRKTPLRAIAERDTKPAKSRKRLPARRATERRSSRVLDDAYLAWVRLQPCAVGFLIGIAHRSLAFKLYPCSGPTDPDHKRQGVGAGKRASDRDAWPVCRRHHDDRHALAGVFKGWTRDQMRAFITVRIAEANAAYEIHLKQAVPA